MGFCYDFSTGDMENIHQNTVKTKMAKKAVDYEFSSAADYAGLRKVKLINQTIAGKYINLGKL